MKPFLARLKRLFALSFAVIAASCCFCLICACVSDGYGGEYADTFKHYDGFSVNFIDVGTGDAIFINFADGKTMLIDCGEKNTRNFNSVKRYLDEYTNGILDYLVLTHPDADHVGNAAQIIESYIVNTAFVPYINERLRGNFNLYNQAYTLLEESGAEIKISAVGRNVCGEKYSFIMLSPNAKGTTDSAYDTFNSYEDPPDGVRNDISPIIYLEYMGVRFILTGDAGFSQEKVALDNVKTGITDGVLQNKGKDKINLTDIDFLKVSHHGSNGASGAEFLQALSPKNAVISVGGDNAYGFPTKDTLSRIAAANENCSVYLTSVCGTVSVFVDESGRAAVHTASAAA